MVSFRDRGLQGHNKIHVSFNPIEKFQFRSSKILCMAMHFSSKPSHMLECYGSLNRNGLLKLIYLKTWSLGNGTT